MFDLVDTLFSDADRARADAEALAPLPQSALWARAAAMLGAGIRPLPHPLGGFAIERRLPVLGPAAMISRGPRALTRARAAGLRAALGARHLVIHAETPEDGTLLAEAGFRQIAAPRWIAEVTLSPNPADMGARLRQKFRNRLRHAMGAGLIVTRRPLPADPRHWILRAEAQDARRLGYRPLPPAMIAALAAARPGAGQLFTAYLAGQRVAAMLFLRHGRAATYQISWSRPEGRAVSAGTLLMWRAMLQLQAMGVDQIDLGAADPRQAPGLARFKRGTGARLRPLGGSWLDSAFLPRRRVATSHRPIAFVAP